MRSLRLCILTKYYLDDQIKETDVGEAYGKYGREGKLKLKARDNLEDLGIHRKIMLE
jgi:hypothetical protein